MPRVKKSDKKTTVTDQAHETHDADNADTSSESSSSAEVSLIPREISGLRIIAETVSTAVPMALSYTFTASQLATALMIARLDAKHIEALLGAASLITLSNNFLFTFFGSPLFAMSLLGSKQVGKLTTLSNDAYQKTTAKIANIFKSGIGLACLLSLPPMVAMYFSQYTFTEWFKQDSQVASHVQDYLRIYSFAFPAVMIRHASEQIMFSFGKTTPAMILGLISLAMGTGLAYYLAFPYGLGIPGIAYGYLAESYLTALIFNFYIACHPAFKGIHFLSCQATGFNFYHQANKILKVGLTISAQMFFELVSSFAIGVFAGLAGRTQLAAHNFATQLFTLAVLPSIAFGQTTAQKVSKLIGECDYRNAMRHARYGLLTSMAVVSAACAVVIAKPEWLTIVLARSLNRQEMYFAKKIIPLAGAQTILDTASFGMVQTLRASGDIYLPTVLKILCIIFGTVGAYFLAKLMSVDLVGIELGALLGFALAAMMILPRWLHGTSAEQIELGQQKSPREESPSSNAKQSNTSYYSGTNSMIVFGGTIPKNKQQDEGYLTDDQTTRLTLQHGHGQPGD